MRRFLALVLLIVIALGAVAAWWLQAPLPVRADVPAGQPLELEIEPGTTPRSVARAVVRSGMATDADVLFLWFRLSGKDREIKAGNYEIPQGTSPYALLQKLVRGEEALRAVTLVEGWTFRQVRQALESHPELEADTAGLSDAEILARIGASEKHLEGLFFPDTYLFDKRSGALAVLKRAYGAMQAQLERTWAERDPATPLGSPYEALILASIIEKETGRPEDRGLVASVFSNRLRIGMRLQTDPSVIYGLGPDFDGRLRRSHLDTDHPWNTYTRAGLPPTPIAIPGEAALRAAVNPDKSEFLYFVARGDGSSEFSRNLAEHNRAVNKFIRNGGGR